MTGQILLVRSRKRAVLAKARRLRNVETVSDNGETSRAPSKELRVSGRAILRGAHIVGRVFRIRDGNDERRIRATANGYEMIIVEFSDWKIIPLENLIAALRGRTRVFASAKSLAEAEVFLRTLETGVDGVVVSPSSAPELVEYHRLLRSQDAPKLSLVRARIRSITPAGVGDRVCVDTASLLDPREGLLIGSSGNAYFLIASENHENDHVAPRPFRVNAGAVHSYLLDGGKTLYLSELLAGARIHTTRPDGAGRNVVVGRTKIETRPLLRIEAEAAGRSFSVLVQDAETVRLVTGSGAPRSVKELSPRDQVLCHLEDSARHFGMPITEHIVEQ